MKKNFSKIVIIFSSVSTALLAVLFIALGIGAILLMDEIMHVLIYTAGIFLLLFGTFLLASMLLILITSRK